MIDVEELRKDYEHSRLDNLYQMQKIAEYGDYINLCEKGGLLWYKRKAELAMFLAKHDRRIMIVKLIRDVYHDGRRSNIEDVKKFAESELISALRRELSKL